MAINSGTLYSSDITASTTSAGVGVAPDQRRLYDFSNRVAELSPEETPFFVYLSNVAKTPTTDPVFRFLENRSKIDWTSRDFYLANSMDESNVTAGSSYTFSVDDGSASIDWLIKGMVFAVQTADGSAGAAADVSAAQVIVRVETAPVDAGAYTTFTGKVISLSNSAAGTDYNDLSDGANCQIIGTSYKEGTGAPDVWSSTLEDDYGYTQIFKTAAEMTNTAIATNYRGYANEWDRIWNLKLREHKVDIERGMLFGQRARIDGLQYTEGLVGHILSNCANPQTNHAANLSYTSGQPYIRSEETANMGYDVFLRDFEVLFDPARGGSENKLALASMPVVTYFNKLSGGFVDNSIDNQSRYNFDANKREGSFGHKVLQIETVHGSLSLIKEPLFRGVSSGFLLLADMSQVAYRPLIGNGLNRDTHIVSNVQASDEDLRKDMILTEAGLEITIPETQMLYNFTDL